MTPRRLRDIIGRDILSRVDVTRSLRMVLLETTRKLRIIRGSRDRLFPIQMRTFVHAFVFNAR